jgi:hypothetical protein
VTAAEVLGPSEKSIGHYSGRHSGPARKELDSLQKAPAYKTKANELNRYSSGCSLVTAARRPTPGPLSEAESAPLHAGAVGSKAAHSLGATPTGEQAAKSSRQLNYAEVGVRMPG